MEAHLTQTQEDLKAKRTALRRSLREMRDTGVTACGGCQRQVGWKAYRCFYCGFWFCRRCGSKHFEVDE